MNYKVTIYYLSAMLKLVAACVLAPIAISLYCGEPDAVVGFLITAGAALGIAGVLDIIRHRGAHRGRGIYTRDGFMLVAVCWLAVSLFGALPYYFSGAVPSFIDSLFESVSGFTTTGSSILPAVEAMPRGLLFWRSFTHWVGGMGVLLLLLTGSGGELSINMARAEGTGPLPGKLVPRLRQSSRIIFIIYISMTLVQTILLVFGGMPVYDSVCTAMSTAATGGFHVRGASFAAYDSLYFEAVTAFFMLAFGMSFNVVYLLLIRSFRSVLKSEELRVYLALYIGSTLAVAANLAAQGGYGFSAALRRAAFQVSAMMTTTGFYTDDFSMWPQFSRVLLLVLMTIGACAGSTGGGIKISRLVILAKEAKRGFTAMARPRAVSVVTLDGKTLDRSVTHSVTRYFAVYCFIIVLSIILVSLDDIDMQSTVTGVLANVGNSGPGLGLAGPDGDYSGFSVLSKLVFSMDMLLGRMEIYPLLLLLSPASWRRV